MSSINNNLSHQEAIEEVYQLTPQIKDYDRFMHVGARWLPYTMYFHEKNFTSDTINTDSLGFRYSHLNNHRYSVAQLPQKNTPINLLVGGSTALGVGSTSDQTSLASYLSQKTGEVWLNFSGRGYNSAQELILFLMHQSKFNQINQVVVLSGMNTLALEGIPDELSSDHGRYYYSYEFQHYMGLYNNDMKRKADSFSDKRPYHRTLVKKLKSFLHAVNPADTVITDDGVELEARIVRAATEITRSLYQWKLLLSGSNTKLSFALQPLAYWTRDYLTSDESAVFNAIDHCPNNFYRLFSGVLGNEVHPIFYNAIQQDLEKYGIPCYDSNLLLANSDRIAQTLFVDRVHFNDKGNALLADLLIEQVIKSKQEATTSC